MVVEGVPASHVPPIAGSAAAWTGGRPCDFPAAAFPGFAEEYLAAVAHAHAAHPRGHFRGLYVPAGAYPGGVFHPMGYAGAADAPPCWRGPTAPDNRFVPCGAAAGTGRPAAVASVEELVAAAARVPTSATTLRLMREARRAARAHGGGRAQA